jgi:putative transposase
MPWKNASRIEQRKQLVMALLARRETVVVICRRFGVSRQSAYKFRRRFLQSGGKGLHDLPRGPKRKHPRTWSQFRRQLLAERRRRPTWGARKLLWWLRTCRPHSPLPAERTVARWLQAAGLVRARRVRRRIEPPALQPARRGRRSNEVWTIDWKGWIRTGDGAKIEPLTIRDLGSRFVLWVLPLARRSDAEVRRVCRRLFRRHGRPKAIRTDLGGPFCSTGPYGLTTLSLWWYRLGIGVEFVRRSAGIDNNAHEQMHRVLQAETANPPAPTRRAQLQRLRRWRHDYNHLRPHDGIGQQPPARRYRSEPGPLPALLTPAYPPAWLVRRVTHRGAICLFGQRHYIGRTFAGLLVGCKPAGSGARVYYHRLLLATINRPLSSQTAAPSPP